MLHLFHSAFALKRPFFTSWLNGSSSSSSSLFARKKEKYNTYVIKNKKYQKAYNFPGEEAH